MVADDTAIIYVIGIGCALFGVVTAYLIYKHVQEEKSEYYRNKIRRSQLGKDPINFDYTAPNERKQQPSEPVVAPKEEDADNPDHSVPVPAPILAPIAIPPIPTTEPVATTDKAPLLVDDGPPPKTESDSNLNEAFFAATTAVAVNGAAGAGAVATYQAVQKPDDIPKDDQPKKKKNKGKKRKDNDKNASEGDFDDYRHFSPTILPPPRGAPPPANYTSSAEAPEPEARPSNDFRSIDVEQRDSRDLTLPRVAIADRDGLLF